MSRGECGAYEAASTELLFRSVAHSRPRRSAGSRGARRLRSPERMSTPLRLTPDAEPARSAAPRDELLAALRAVITTLRREPAPHQPG